jgi:hypothetical protein
MNRRTIEWLVCAVIVCLSASYTFLEITPSIGQNLMGDADGFSRLSEVLLRERFFWDSTRTYGYPLFLAIIRGLLPGSVDWIPVVKLIQFVLHTCTAVLAVKILDRLAAVEEREVSSWARVLTFALVQFNLLLLAILQEILTDSISVFFITIFFYGVIAQEWWKWGIAGLALGIAAVIRPFYLNYAIAFTLVVSSWWVAAHIRSLRSAMEMNLLRKAALIGIPFLILIGSQFMQVWHYEERIAFTGEAAASWTNIHLDGSYYYYKHESFVGSNDRSPHIPYYNSRRLVRFQNRDPEESILLLTVLDPLGTIYMSILKTVALFQNYEWSVYRTTLLNTYTHPIFIYGFVMLYQFSTLILAFIMRFKEMFSARRMAFNALFTGIMLHVFLYSLLTIPESRFIVPIFPILTTCTIYSIWSKPDKRILIASLVISLILYAYTYIELIAAQS